MIKQGTQDRLIIYTEGLIEGKLIEGGDGPTYLPTCVCACVCGEGGLTASSSLLLHTVGYNWT